MNRRPVVYRIFVGVAVIGALLAAYFLLPGTNDGLIPQVAPSNMTATKSAVPISTAKDKNHLGITVSGERDAFDILLTAPDGHRTGLDPATGKNIYEISNSGFYTDSLDNDVTGERGTSAASSIEVDHPQTGLYTLDVHTAKPGDFVHIAVDQFSRKFVETALNADSTLLSMLHIAGSSDMQQFAVDGNSLSIAPDSVGSSLEVRAWNTQTTL